MKKILILNTGGTFNKIYNPLNGMLEIDPHSQALNEIADKWLHPIEIENIITKDSLEITNQDRLELLDTISQSSATHIIVVHGTDTMDISATYLAQAKLEKSIIFTGAMIPYSIDPVEASLNLASAYGYLLASNKQGIYISMHGHIEKYNTLKKDPKKGQFISSYGSQP